MEKAAKRELVSTMNEVFQEANVVVVAHYAGLTVAELTALRGKARQQGVSVKVAKNRLVKLALQGTDSAHIADLFTGPTLVAYSADPVAAPKVTSDFAKTNDKLVILGGGEFVGGRVSPSGAVIGALTLTLAGSFLSFMRISPDWQIGAQGGILIVVLALRLFLNRLEKGEKKRQ